MDKNAARLELFRQAVNKQADAEAAEILRQAEQKRAALDSDRRRRSADEALAEIKAQRDKAAASARRELSRLDHDIRNAGLAHRRELMDGFFADLRDRLREFTRGSGYEQYLRSAVTEAERTLGANAVILAREQDIPALKAMTSLPVEQDSSISLGGISAADRTRGHFIDLTLDSRLAEEKAAFPEHSGLRL